MAIHKPAVHNGATAGSGKYEDGYGPRQDVSESGAKNWVLRRTLHRRSREVGFGSYPSVGPADAGTSTVKCRRPVAKGVAPDEARRMVAKRIPCSLPAPHLTSWAIGTAGIMPTRTETGHHT